MKISWVRGPMNALSIAESGDYQTVNCNFQEAL